ncbi:hypothetical protein HAZT_HAZT007334 [Hyalella azteca]|uniref:CLIP domain-containing serine protease n=1 Tax=Hyalella azteca TaxID=294128 RepID=A0A6A0HCQ9_HYAAZ|nr:hypothetical protein HAZT_HAZT007334 [Hyalella azteca]
MSPASRQRYFWEGCAVLLIIATIGVAAQGSCRMDDGGPGECIELLQCQQHVSVITAIRSGRAPTSEYARLRRLVCAIRAGNVLLLCCPAESLLPSDCGLTAQPDRIVGGEDAYVGGWPWIAMLYGSPTPSSDKLFFCGGSLITSRYVLTAAHCIYRGDVSTIDLVRLGEHTVSRDIDCENNDFGQQRCAPHPQDIRPESAVLHPNYDRPGCLRCNDIALIRLSANARLNEFVRPVCLPINPVQQMGFAASEFIGKFGWAAGWGSVGRSLFDTRQPDVLQQVQLQVLSCSSPGVLCALGPGKDTCRGDSGGPFVLSDSRGLRFFLVGVTSSGNVVCATEGVSTRYTAVHEHIPWITQTLRP